MFALCGISGQLCNNFWRFLDKEPKSMRLIWMYNLYTEKWSKHEVSDTSDVPEPFDGAAATAINGTIYSFGGNDPEDIQRNALWALSTSKTRCFTWSFIKFQYKKESHLPELYILDGHIQENYGYLEAEDLNQRAT